MKATTADRIRRGIELAHDPLLRRHAWLAKGIVRRSFDRETERMCQQQIRAERERAVRRDIDVHLMRGYMG